MDEEGNRESYAEGALEYFSTVLTGDDIVWGAVY
jgi:hypothetical protein